MQQLQNTKYDLEERTFVFAVSVREFLKVVTPNIANTEYSRQLARSSGSVAANYIEANESLSKKDFAMRAKICCKEAKESQLWLKLLQAPLELIDEASQLTKIFGVIVEKSR